MKSSDADPEPMHELIAAEVRAQLARQRRSGRSVALQLGWSSVYMSRRLTGAVPFNVTDLAAIAGVLDVPVITFFQGPGVRTPGFLHHLKTWEGMPTRPRHAGRAPVHEGRS